MNSRFFLVLTTLLSIPSGCQSLASPARGGAPEGFYVAALETEHGTALPFFLEVYRGDVGEGDAKAWIHNGPERIEIPDVTLGSDELKLGMPHYASTVTATWDKRTAEFVGEWRKRRGPDEIARVPFRARPGHGPRFESATGTDDRFVGEWRVRFEGEGDPAKARFEAKGGEVLGTFMTTTGDYRYLAGGTEGDVLKLSCFDGAHAFLFEATLDAGDRLQGRFSYGNWGGVDWTARRDDEFELANPFEETQWVDGVELRDMTFPDLRGTERNLASPEFAGKARIIYIFGSWCPNCHDAARYLGELHEKYAGRGLSIVGLAFELTGDFDTDREQVARYIERHGTKYPVLLAGVSDKSVATRQLRALTAVKSYPTTIFVDADGVARRIYTGFSGPATGAAYDELKSSFEAVIEGLLRESP